MVILASLVYILVNIVIIIISRNNFKVILWIILFFMQFC